MNLRTLAVAGVLAALAAPAAASAGALPQHRPALHPAKQSARKHGGHRVLCICVPSPVGPVFVQSEEDFEALVDQDMVAHGLPPIYGTEPDPFATDG